MGGDGDNGRQGKDILILFMIADGSRGDKSILNGHFTVHKNGRIMLAVIQMLQKKLFCFMSVVADVATETQCIQNCLQYELAGWVILRDQYSVFLIFSVVWL